MLRKKYCCNKTVVLLYECCEAFYFKDDDLLSKEGCIEMRKINKKLSQAEMSRDKDGEILSDEREVIKRWKQHFKEHLNGSLYGKPSIRKVAKVVIQSRCYKLTPCPISLTKLKCFTFCVTTLDRIYRGAFIRGF